MYSSIISYCIFCLVMMITTHYSYSQVGGVPRQISYQGVLREGDKIAADGTYSVIISLYNQATGGGSLWQETQNVEIKGGLFNIILGQYNGLPAPLPADAWIGINFNGMGEMPRTKLTSVPYTFNAATAQSLMPNATGAVLSLNGQQGAIELRATDGFEVRTDKGVLTIGKTPQSKEDEVLNQGTEWLLAGNGNANANSWLGTSNNIPLIVKTSNTERMRILSSNGNVGIGETNPSSRLSVARTLHITNTGGTPELKLSAPSGANSTTFKTTGQSANITYTLPSNDGNDGDVLTTDGTGQLTWEAAGWGTTGNNATNSSFLGTINAQPLIVKTNNVERYRVTSSGAMGINEDNPTQKLEVAGNIVVKTGGTNTGELRLQEPSGNMGNNYTGFKAGNLPSNIIYTLPTSQPLDGQVLSSNAQGNLSWSWNSNTIPSGYMISSTSTSVPDGYSYMGVQMTVDSIVWTSKANMPTPRRQLGAAVGNGKIYAIGGYNGTFLTVNEEYNPTTNTWQTRAAMTTRRRGLGCETVGSHIYALMGYDSVTNALGTTERYNYISNSWETRTSNTGVLSSFGTGVVGGNIYCLGGSSGGDGQFSSLSSRGYRYNTGSNTWDTLVITFSGFSYFWFNGTQACVVNDKLYFAGGTFHDPALLMRYDPATKYANDESQLPILRRYYAMQPYGNDIIITGGQSGSSGPPNTTTSGLTSTYFYNTINKQWRSGPSLPIATWGCASVIISNKLYVIGGMNGATYLNNLQELTLGSKTLYFYTKN